MMVTVYTEPSVAVFESYAKDSICHCNNYAVPIIYHLINITCSFSVNYPQIIASTLIISAFLYKAKDENSTPASS